MQSNKTQQAERVTFHVVRFGDMEAAQNFAVEREVASKRQIVPCAVTPGATVTIEGRKLESGDEIRIVGQEELKNMSLSDRQRSATRAEIEEARKLRAVIMVNERELAMNRRRRLTPGAPFTHKIVATKGGTLSMRTNAGSLDVGCYVGPDDFHQPAVPERVEPEQRKLIKLGEVVKYGETHGWFVEAFKPEHVIPGKPGVDGAERLRDLEAQGRVAPIEEWEWKFAEAEIARDAERMRKAG